MKTPLCCIPLVSLPSPWSPLSRLQVEGKEERQEPDGWERSASLDIPDDAPEGTEAGAYERLQMERRRLQAKQHHSERRKAWLRKNQALLRVFLSYCSLHGAKGGGVTSVRMELIFLLQESQQVRAHTHSLMCTHSLTHSLNLCLSYSH